MYYSVSKLESKLYLVLMWRFVSQIEASLYDTERTMENCFLGPLNIYLQHVLQTIIYFMKMQSRNTYFKYKPRPLNGDPLMF